jgi:valyl-tRNA synthetase
VVQDEDVLDTWFSSGLLPFSVFGWPDTNSEELKAFFPTDLLETGHDIIFFWVSRMIFMSYFFMDQVPFKTVYLHPIIKDKEGRKMSKSVGNVIDPLQVIGGAPLQELIDAIQSGNLPKQELERSIREKQKEFPDGIPECGADSLRLGLMSYLVQGRNINLDLSRVVGYRYFGNKLWNAFKFLKIYLEKDFKHQKIIKEKLTFFDKWILSKLSQLIKNFEKDFDVYNFGDATNQIYSFWYDCVFNRYIEALKIILSDKSPYDEETKTNTKNVFLYIFECGLIILHPLTPFLTEELFQRLPARNSKAPSICISSFPIDEGYKDLEVDKNASDIFDIIHEVQSILQEFNILNAKPKLNISTTDKTIEKIIVEEKEVIKGLSKSSEITVKSKDDKEIEGYLSHVINERIDVFLDIRDKINLDGELTRLNKNLADKEKYINGLRKKISNKEYQKRAKEELVKEDNQKLEKAEAEMKKIQESIENLNKLKK